MWLRATPPGSTTTGGALGGAICALRGARGLAYLPMPLALALSNEPGALALAAAVAFVLPFAVGVTCNARANRRAEAASRSHRRA
jgi:hypothetical protein